MLVSWDHQRANTARQYSFSTTEMNASSSRPRKQNPGQRVQGTKDSEGFSGSIHRSWALHIHRPEQQREPHGVGLSEWRCGVQPERLEMEARRRLHGPERLCWPAAWQLLRHPHPHTHIHTHNTMTCPSSIPRRAPELRLEHDPICAFGNSADVDISFSLLVLYASVFGPRRYSRHGN